MRNKNCVVYVRLTETLKAKVEDIADENELNLSETIRGLLFQAIRNRERALARNSPLEPVSDEIERTKP